MDDDLNKLQCYFGMINIFLIILGTHTMFISNLETPFWVALVLLIATSIVIWFESKSWPEVKDIFVNITDQKIDLHNKIDNVISLMAEMKILVEDNSHMLKDHNQGENNRITVNKIDELFDYVKNGFDILVRNNLNEMHVSIYDTVKDQKRLDLIRIDPDKKNSEGASAGIEWIKSPETSLIEMECKKSGQPVFFARKPAESSGYIPINLIKESASEYDQLLTLILFENVRHAHYAFLTLNLDFGHKNILNIPRFEMNIDQNFEIPLSGGACRFENKRSENTTIIYYRHGLLRRDGQKGWKIIRPLSIEFI